MNKRSGLFTLLALGAAYWKWGMNKDQKDSVKRQISSVGQQLRDNIPQNLKDTANKYTGRVSSSTAQNNPLNMDEKITY